MAIEYDVQVEFVSGSYTSLAGELVRTSVDRKIGGGIFWSLTAGSMTAELRNEDGKYSPDNAGSALAGLIRPGLSCKVIATDTDTSSEYRLFTGEIDEWTVRPAPGGATFLRARDSIRGPLERTITTSFFTNFNIGSLYTEVFSKMNVASFSVTPFADDAAGSAWFQSVQGKTALDRINQAFHYYVWADPYGTVKVHHRYLEVDSRANINSYDSMMTLGYNLAADTIINHARVEGRPRTTLNSAHVVGQLAETITVPASGFASFWLDFIDPLTGEPAPAVNIVTPVNSTDYTMNTLSGGGGTDKTSTASAQIGVFGQTCVNTVFNGSNVNVYLTKYQVRGTPVVTGNRFVGESEINSSQTTFGRQKKNTASELVQDASYAQDYAEYLTHRYHRTTPEVRLGIRNQYPDVLAAEIGDRLHIINSHTGIGSSFMVTGLSHVIEGRTHNLNMALDLQRTDAYYSSRGVNIADAEIRALNSTGMTGGYKGTLSFWMQFNPTSGTGSIFTNIMTDTGSEVGGKPRQHVYVDKTVSNNYWNVRLQLFESSANSLMLNLGNASLTNTIGGFDVWWHVAASWDTRSNLAHLYINDVDRKEASPIISSASNINYPPYPGGVLAMGDVFNNGAYQGQINIQELYYNIADYIDLSVEANRRKFYSSDGKPVMLNDDGSEPTGTAPYVYLRGSAPDDFLVNHGSGSNWELSSGSAILARATSSPGD